MARRCTPRGQAEVAIAAGGEEQTNVGGFVGGWELVRESRPLLGQLLRRNRNCGFEFRGKGLDAKFFDEPGEIFELGERAAEGAELVAALEPILPKGRDGGGFALVFQWVVTEALQANDDGFKIACNVV